MTAPSSQRSRNGKAPARVSQLDEHLGFWLRFVSNHVSGRFRGLVEEAGVSVSEWVALRALYTDSASRGRSLVQSLGMTKGAVSKLLDRLERKNLVRRSVDPEDGRAQLVALTAAGRALVPRLASLADQNDAHFFGHVSVAERRALAKVLRGLVHHHQLTELPID
ncbi:MAG: MarR family winged helix-turn-helix transcriptional regulator [Polyangiaceae bacterium]